MLFIEGLLEPLCGWVKDFNPETLQDVIVRTRDMEGAVPKTKKKSKPFIPQKIKNKNPPGKEGIGKEILDEATNNELRRKNIFFHYKYPWVPGHKFQGKGQAHYIEVHLDYNEEEEE
jgi:hypothetical protein